MGRGVELRDRGKMEGRIGRNGNASLRAGGGKPRSVQRLLTVWVWRTQGNAHDSGGVEVLSVKGSNERDGRVGACRGRWWWVFYDWNVEVGACSGVVVGNE